MKKVYYFHINDLTNNSGTHNIFQFAKLLPSSVKMSISSSSSESLSFRKSSGLQLRFTNMIMITKLWRAPILFELYFNQNDIGHLKRLYIYIACVFNTFCYRYLRKIISHKSSNSPCDGSLIKQLLNVLTTRDISIHLCQTKFRFDLLSYRVTYNNITTLK